MKKYLPKLEQCILIIMLLSGVAMCVFWMPSAISYLEDSCDALAGNTELLYLGFLVVIIPLFAIFFMAFAFVPAFTRDSIFDKKTAALIKKIAVIILCDCLLFGVLSGCIFVLGEKVLSLLFIFVAMIGITVSAMLFILADHVNQASELKEEVEGTL